MNHVTSVKQLVHVVHLLLIGSYKQTIVHKDSTLYLVPDAYLSLPINFNNTSKLHVSPMVVVNYTRHLSCKH